MTGTATVDAKELASAVTWAMRAVPSRPAQPALTALPITVDGGELTTSGFDYETCARAVVPADGHLDTVHALGSMLAKVAPQLSGTVTLAVDGARLRVSAGRDKYLLPIVPADDYPTLPVLPPAVGDSPGFIDAVSRVVQSAAAAEFASARPVLAGVSLVAQDGVLTLRATDGYRMSRAVIGWDGQDFTTVAPLKMLSEYSKAIGVGRVTLHVDDQHFAVTSGGFTASTLLIDAPYPVEAFTSIDQARAAAEADGGGVFIASRAEVVGAIRRASIALGPNQPLRLEFDEDGECAASAVGDAEATVGLIGRYYGPPHVALVTASFLLSVVEGAPSPYVALGVSSNGVRSTLHVVGSHDDSGAPEEAVQHVVLGRRDMAGA